MNKFQCGCRLAVAVACLAWQGVSSHAFAAPPSPGVRPFSEDESFRSAVGAADAIVIADVRVLDRPVAPPGQGNMRTDIYVFDVEVAHVTWLKGRPVPLRYVAHHRLFPGPDPGLTTVRWSRAILFLEQPSTIVGSGISPAVWFLDSQGYAGGAVRTRDERELAGISKRVTRILDSQTIPELARAADLVVYGTAFGDRGVVCAPFGTPVTCPLFHVERSLKGGSEGEVLRIFSVVRGWSPTDRHSLVFLRHAPRGTFEVLQSPAGAIDFDPTGHDRFGVPVAERLAAARTALVGSRRRN